MTQTSPTLTGQELAIMKVVWGKKEATVREVYETLRERRRIAYTTVMTMMKILQEKGYLTKVAQDRAHVYTATRPRQQVVGAMVKDFVDRVFDGAASGLLVHLAKDGRLTSDERDQIRRVLEEMDE